MFGIRVNVITAATSRMTKFVYSNQSNTSIIVGWKEPEIAPEQFTVNARCKHLFNNETYLTSEAFVPANETSFMLNDLVPETQCDFNLKAVYNPASIDNGICASVNTLPSSKAILFSKGLGEIMCLTLYVFISDYRSALNVCILMINVCI